MANCVTPWVEDEYGNCIYQPVDPGGDITYTGFGTGTFEDPEFGSDLGQIEEFLGLEDVDYETYAHWFDAYTDTPYWQREQFLRGGAETDIEQLYDTWSLRSGQLFEEWYGPEGQKGRLGELQTGAGTTWGLMAGEYDPVTGLGGDIGRREWEAGVGWGFTQNELARLRGEYATGWEIEKGGLEETWLSKKEGIGVGARSGLRQVGAAQETALSSIGFATAGTSAFDRMQREIREGYGREIAEGERALEYGIAYGEYGLGRRYAALGWDPETGEWEGGRYESGLNAYNAAMASLGFERTLGQDRYDNEIARLQHLIDTGEMTYNQAIAAGEWGLGMSATDIGQALEQDVWGTQQDWRDAQTRQMHNLLQTHPATEDGNGNGDVKIYGCTKDGDPNYNPDATDDDGSCERDEFSCESQGMVDCGNGLCADNIGDCGQEKDIEDFWIDPDTGNECWMDVSGNEQCLDWDFGILEGWDLDIDMDWDIDLGEGWTLEGEGIDVNIEYPELDTQMTEWCANEHGTENIVWDPSSGSCLPTGGDYEATDENVFIEPNDCGPGMIPTGTGACIGYDPTGPDGGGGKFQCAGPCAIFFAGLELVGVDPKELFDDLQDEISINNFVESMENMGEGVVDIAEGVWCFINPTQCPEPGEGTSVETGGAGGMLPGDFALGCDYGTCPDGSCKYSDGTCPSDYPNPFN